MESEINQINDDPNLPDKSLFRVDEVADYFGFSRSTIYLWIDHGILKAEKYRGSLRISRVSILNCRFIYKKDPKK